MTNKRPVAIDHTHENSTSTYDGFQSKEDKNKVDSIGLKMVKKLQGKKVVVYGDSVAWGQVLATSPYISSVNWVNTFRELTGATVTNRAKGGTTFANINSDSFCNIVDTDSFTGFDVCLIAYGLNDHGNNIALGRDTYSTVNKSLFKDAIQYSIIKLRTLYPTMKLVFILPNYATSQFTLNTQKLNRMDYMYAIEQICNLYHIPVIDIYGGLGVNSINASAMYWDGVMHPTEATQVKMGELIAQEYPGKTGLIYNVAEYRTMTLINGFTALTTITVSIDVYERVIFNGVINVPNVAVGTVGFILPVHMRPKRTLTLSTITGSAIPSYILIYSNGNVTFGHSNVPYDLSSTPIFDCSDTIVV